MLISEEQDIQQCHHDNESNHSSAVLQHPVQQQVVFNYIEMFAIVRVCFMTQSLYGQIDQRV